MLVMLEVKGTGTTSTKWGPRKAELPRRKQLGVVQLTGKNGGCSGLATANSFGAVVIGA